MDKELLEKVFSVIEKACQEGVPAKKLETLKNFFKVLNKVCYYSPKICLSCFKNKLIAFLDKIFAISESLSKGLFLYNINLNEMFLLKILLNFLIFYLNRSF